MLTARRSADRGHANHGWLDSYHTFSFASYFDPRFVGFHDLLVINEDRVQPGHGFPIHSHKDMEILSFVLEGAIEHKDSTGTGAVLRPGELQRMSAGGGVRHSELNPSNTEVLHFLQIWISPKSRGLPASYEQTQYSIEERTNRLRLIGSEDARDGSVTIHQDVNLYTSLLSKGASVELSLQPGRAAWVQVTRGSLTVGDVALEAGDGLSAEDERALRIVGQSDAELLLFDLG